MKKLRFIIALLLSSIPLLGMDDMTIFLENAYKKNKELKSLEASLDVARQQIAVASNLSNPILNFGATDIWLSDIQNRDSEPMQAYFLGITQSFPLTKKLETKKKISRNEYQIQKYNLEDRKLKFKSDIALYAYNIALIEQRVLLFTELEENLAKLETFLKELYRFNKANQNQILKTQVLKDEIKVKKIDLYNLLQVQTLSLEKITYTKYENININLELKERKLLANTQEHPKLLNLNEQIKKYENVAKFEKQNKNSDLKVSLTYFERDEKFEDYVNLGFAIPLSIYNTENINSRKATFKTLELKNSFEDMKVKFENEIQVFQSNLDSSVKRYKIIRNEILPKLNQVQKNLENYNSFSGINSTELVKNLNEIIKYELEAINEKQKYFTNLAKSYYFSKELP